MNIQFNEDYYADLMIKFGYDPLKFGRINFDLGELTKKDLQRCWLCHHDGLEFSEAQKKGHNTVVSTGLGLSGTPHIGTLSQILRAIRIQDAGIPVNMVLGDLDAYNGKGKSLEYTLELAEKYRKFVSLLGLSQKDGSVLRSQWDFPEVNRTAYIIGHYVDDNMFDESEEDLHNLYAEKGKVDSSMSYRRKLSLNLMAADFFHLHESHNADNVLVMLGVDEHQYVLFAKNAEKRMREDGVSCPKISGLYSTLITGFNGFPKMSKSFPESGITLDMDADIIQHRILHEDKKSILPELNPVYQMMISASHMSLDELQNARNAYLKNDKKWINIKEDYAEELISICQKWKNMN